MRTFHTSFMKCPRCGLIVTDAVPRCRGCHFGIDDLSRKMAPAPDRSGFVNDLAGLLPPDQQAPMEARLAALHAATGGELVLVTVQTTCPVKPAEYVFWLFNQWRVGGANHRGLMLLLAAVEHRIECEVGYGWEDIVSDPESGDLLDRHVLPLLASGQIAEALDVAVNVFCELLEAAASDATETAPAAAPTL